MRKHTAILAIFAMITAFTGPLPAQGADQSFPEPHPNPLTEVKVIGFRGGFNLPIWVAQRQGFFSAEKLDVKLDFTPGSRWQITHLLADNYHIAMTAFDNVVAYREGQNEAYIPADIKVDLVSILSSDNGFLSISAQQRIKALADLKGEILTVDAMTTGFAFVLREILARQGIAETEVKFERVGGVSDRFRDMQANPNHAATIQMTPFELLGEAKGFNTLTRARSVLGPYLGMTAAVRQSWAERNRETVVGFVRAYQHAVDWMHDPANRPEVEAILIANVNGLTSALAARAYEIYVGAQGGFRRRVGFDVEGARTVLALRSKFGRPPKQLSDPSRYFDARFLQAAGIE